MDRAIQKTDDDALQSKRAAESKGYIKDELLAVFCSRAPAPRLPLINIGTYCRLFGIDKLTNEFLTKTEGQKRAIISLGAGSDTRGFHLLEKHSDLEYFELDFPKKTQAKEAIIARTPRLQQHSDRYHLIGSDLRTLPSSSTSLVWPKVPTLLISECCLCYLAPEQADGVLSYFNERTSDLSVVLYEPLSLDDEFGRVMAENLAQRGLSLPTAARYSTLKAQSERLQQLVGGKVGAVDIETVYKEWVPKAELERIGKLEFLDEVEEMFLLMRHYCFAFAIAESLDV